MEKVIMYEQIYNHLEKAIRERTYRAGDRLPSEKELQEAYGVSRITAKKAMNLLAEAGYIERRPGRGSFVADRVEDVLGSCRPSSSGDDDCGDRLVGVILDTFGSDFGSVLLRSIEQECRRKGIDMLFYCTYGSIEGETEAIRRALRCGVSGLILVCAQGENYNSRILSLSLEHFPMVLVDRVITGIPIPCIKTDNYLATQDLTKWLIGQGHKKICFLTHGSITTSTIHERYRGFVDCLIQYQNVAGVFAKAESYNTTPEDIGKEYDEFDMTEYQQILLENEDCAAYLATEYKLAVLLKTAAKAIGKDIEIVVFDSLETIYKEAFQFYHVKQDEYAMGKCAVETLDALIRGEIIQDNINIPYELVKGK